MASSQLYSLALNHIWILLLTVILYDGGDTCNDMRRILMAILNRLGLGRAICSGLNHLWVVRFNIWKTSTILILSENDFLGYKWTKLKYYDASSHNCGNSLTANRTAGHMFIRYMYSTNSYTWVRIAATTSHGLINTCKRPASWEEWDLL